VIVDEAYAEFTTATVVRMAERSPNLLVVRTLSKAFGLAGLRVGFGVGSPALVSSVEKSRGPFSVSSLGELAAAAALTEDRAWVQARAADARAARERLSAALAERGLNPLRSEANFVLVPMERAVAVGQAMRSAGVAVRAFGSLPPLNGDFALSGGEALRISVGPWHEMSAALDALDRAIVSCG
jgi:histidinol-phosphate/aromatic aminotransferase/cobyric acid decarboxylase-like protein